MPWGERNWHSEYIWGRDVNRLPFNQFLFMKSETFLIQRNGFRSYTPCFLLLVVVITCTAQPQPLLDTDDDCRMTCCLPQLPHNYLYLPLTLPRIDDRDMSTDWDGREMRYSQPRLPTPMLRSPTAAYTWFNVAHWPSESCQVFISDWT